MTTHLRSLTTGAAGEAAVAEPARSFEEFYEANFRRVFTALCLVTRNRHEAEEVTQEAFLRVLERWDRVGTFDDPTGYVYTAAMNVFRSRYRRASLALRRALSIAPATDELAAVETHDEVLRLLQTLTPSQRAAVVLTALLDFSPEDAARMLGVKASSVRSLTTRARAHMKRKVVDTA
jgi:RNA polymerase sigma-70 factor (ECF subfamily)